MEAEGKAAAAASGADLGRRKAPADGGGRRGEGGPRVG